LRYNLRYMLEKHQLERMENGDILIGLEGEKLTNHFDFYAVFASSIEYSVRYKSQEIGSVSAAFPVGFRFALAGLTWQVVEVDNDRQNIYVEPIKGISRRPLMQGKFNEYTPPEILRKEYIADYIDVDDMKASL